MVRIIFKLNILKAHFKKKLPEPPRIKSQNVVYVKHGDRVQLECSCSDCLPVKSRWNYDNKKTKYSIDQIEDEDDDTFKTVLTIEKETETDEETYKCKLSNDKSKQRRRIQVIAQIETQNIRITSKGKNFKNVKDHLEIKHFETCILNCAAKAFPVPKIIWFKDGVKVGQNQIVLDSNNMKNHPGNYKCFVEN